MHRSTMGVNQRQACTQPCFQLAAAAAHQTGNVARASNAAQVYTGTTRLAEKIMPDIDPELTFRGLPLTAEQNASIRHYIKQQKQQGRPVDTPELEAMLKDMLEPPGDDDEGPGAATNHNRGDAERASAAVDETMDAIGASEERNAAMESEAMKRQQR
jgi:hypothetical protein